MGVRYRGLLLTLLLALPATLAQARGLPVDVARLPVPADAGAVLAGSYDARFESLPAATWRPPAGVAETWFRVALPPVVPASDLVFSIDRAAVDAIEVHVPRAGGAWEILRHGARGAEAAATPASCCFAFPLPRDLAGRAIYVRVLDEVPTRLEFTLQPWPDWSARERGATAVVAVALLALLAMALVNAVFFAVLRERDYLLLVAAQVSMAVWVAYDAGLLASLAGLAWPGMSGLFPWVIAGGAAAFFCTAFMQSYCGLAERAPRYSRILGGARWLVLSLTVATVLPLAELAPVLRDSINASLLGLGALALAAPLMVLRTARRPAMFVLVGWAATVAVLAWKARYNLGYGTPDLLVEHGVPLAAATLALVLSIALAERALDLRQQRDRAEFQRVQAEARLRVAQTRRGLVEGLEGLLQHAGSDLKFTAYKRALAALRHVLPMRGAAWVAEEGDGRRMLVADPADVREKVAEFVRRRAATLRSVAQTGRGIVLSSSDTDQTALDGTPLKAAVVPLRPDDSAWSVLLLAREQWQDFAPEDFEVARDFLALAARAATEGRRRAALQQKASFDALTGALNRGNIESTVEAAFGEAVHARQPLSVLFIDLDHFKKINDLHGHSAGDECLARVTQRIEHVLKPGQALGRYGGEEFLVVLPGADGGEARAVAERIRLSVRERPVTSENLTIPLTVSIGGASRQPGELSWKHMLERADQAVYAAKRQGRDRVSWGDPVAAQRA
jgi:diguanylate cyclase (GGDEF)-like protein